MPTVNLTALPALAAEPFLAVGGDVLLVEQQADVLHVGVLQLEGALLPLEALGHRVGHLGRGLLIVKLVPARRVHLDGGDKAKGGGAGRGGGGVLRVRFCWSVHMASGLAIILIWGFLNSDF